MSKRKTKLQLFGGSSCRRAGKLKFSMWTISIVDLSDSRERQKEKRIDAVSRLHREDVDSTISRLLMSEE